ncbi:MAG: GTPase HflX, partial [Clostridia bacterium]|nr:GTPase HflX [Clostridia bacterium]
MEQREMALLVGVNQSGQKDHEYTMKELRSLAYACDTEVVGEVVQNLDVINASHYIGSGKLDEVKALLKAKGANLVICNDELTPSQIRNLEKELECKLIDRTALILDIFARRARTKEAQMQVEIAQLKYMLPRLVGLRESLGRQSGGVGTCNRGSGEKKLELDRRKIGRKIAMLNEELESLVIERQTQRKLRERR